MKNLKVYKFIAPLAEDLGVTEQTIINRIDSGEIVRVELVGQKGIGKSTGYILPKEWFKKLLQDFLDSKK